MNNHLNIFLSTQKWAQELQIPSQFFELTESTNLRSKTIEFDHKDDLNLIVADQQSQGRGRGPNSWLNTSAGKSLLSSWVYNLFESPQHISSPLFGLHLWIAAQSTWPQYNWSLKPPNDLYLDSKKIAGLLIETLSQGSTYLLIIGLGFNALESPSTLDSSGCLPQQANLNEYQWFEFLNSLKKEFKLATKKCIYPYINKKDQKLLMNILNDFPLKENAIIDISSDGDITYSNQKKVSWTTL